VPDAPPPPAPVRVGSVVKEPRKLKHVEAAYPRPAVLARVEGLVVLECTIDVTGHVADVRVLRGVPALDQAAVEAVRQWAYAPTLLDGVPVPVIMTVTVSFNLKQARAR
jgi:protein TonB